MVKMLKIGLLVFCLSFSLTQQVYAGTMNDLLLDSIEANNPKMIETALANGADINYIDPTPMGSATPLLIAIRNENLPLVKYLLQKGADPNLMIGQNLRLEVPLLRAMPRMGVITKNTNMQLMQALIDAGASINVKGFNGITPLIKAVSDRGQEPYFINFLLSKGANVNLADESGTTPLMKLAATSSCYTKKTSGHITIAKMLLQAGADPSAKDLQGKNALSYAIDSKSSEMINLLLPITKE